MINHLKEMANVIGWSLVCDNDGYSIYEYTKSASKFEKITYTVNIMDEPTPEQLYLTVQSLKDVLPVGLKLKINKITKNIKIENMSKVVEVLSYVIEEYKVKTEYAKLKAYGEVLGVNIEDLGYPFEYKLIRSKRATILAKIESYLPMELLPQVGKIKKIDYKIAFVKSKLAVNI